MTTPAYSLGFQRVLADFDVFAEAKKSAIFALSWPIVSATQRTPVTLKSAKENSYTYKKSIGYVRTDRESCFSALVGGKISGEQREIKTLSVDDF